MAAPRTPGGVFVRRAEFDDQVSIQALVGEESHLMAKRFGAFDIANMIENASLGITAVDEKGQVVGYAAFYDYPALTPEADAATWTNWFHRAFGHPEYTAANAAWLVFFVADPLSEHEVAESMLRTAFTTLPEVDCVLLALPADARPFAPLKETFEPLQRLSGGEEGAPSVSACPRGLYLPDLLVRDARVEDHDDLVPVFTAQSEVLTERYGEFFIAELIGAQDDRNRALVAEVDGHAVGLMGTSSDIDVAILRDCFQLEPYDGLVKQDQEALRMLREARQQAHAEEQADEARREAAQAEAEAQAEEEAAAVEAVEAGAASPTVAAEEGEGEGEEEVTAEEIERRAAEAAAAKAAKAEEAAAAKAKAKVAREAAEEAAIPLICNAFCITVFAIDESFESRSKEMLEKAFALYPDKQYAVITLPHTTPEFPLLNAFTQADPMPTSSFGHLLYLFHRDALLPSLTVRPANVLDAAAVSSLTSTLEQHGAIAADFAAATGHVAVDEAGGAENRPLVAFVVECSGSTVGIVLLDTRCDAAALRSRYALEDFILFPEHKADHHIELRSFVINPIFARSSRYVLKEIFRQLKKSCLYFSLLPGMPLPDVLGEFVQVKPRRQIAISPRLAAEIAKETPTEAGGVEQAGGALFFITRKLISEPKVVNNARIVVIGVSDTAIGFLEALLTVPYLTFTNLYLLAPHAAERLRTPRGCTQPEDGEDGAATGGAASATPSPSPFLSHTCGYSCEELRQLAIGARVRLVDGRVAGIERARKAVVLPDDSILPYDYLVVAPELGDQTLVPLGPEASGVRGAFSLADHEAVAACDAFLHSSGALEAKPTNGALVVYGASLDALCAVQALLSRGVPPSRIISVQPPAVDGAPDALADPRVADKVASKLAALGVRVDRDTRLAGLESDEANNLSACLLELPRAAPNAPANVQALPCQALLCCGAAEIDRETFRALNSNSIVYDGGLVIDDHFRTNDPAIYAGGAVTKFARKCRFKLRLALCNPREVGVQLAHALLPTLDSLSGTSLSSEPLEPVLTQPRAEGGLLPGGLHYLNVTVPKAGSHSYETIIADKSFGRELIFDGGDDSFCTVRLDVHGAVHSMVYLGPRPVESRNWVQLVGLPEAAINRLAARYDEGIVPDLPAFLRQNWAIALYHDRFGEFRSSLRLELNEDDDCKRLLAAARPAAVAGESLKVAEYLEQLPEPKRALVHARLLDYIQTNQNHLDMYLVPSSSIMKKMEDTKLK